MLAWMSELLGAFLNKILNLFPMDPFREPINKLANLPYLGYLNWFVPVSEMIAIGMLWLAAIALYYVWSVVARWIKLIQ